MNFIDMWWLLKEPFLCFCFSLLAAGVLGHCLGALADGVFGQLTRQQQSNRCLDLARTDGASFVVVSETRGFTGNSLEDIIHKGVHDAHGLARDTSVGMNLSEDLVDVD